MEEGNIVVVEQDVNEKGHSYKRVQLKHRTKEFLKEALKLMVTTEKPPLSDLENFEKIMTKLLNPVIRYHAADSIQILSKQYRIPFDSGFFPFLEKHINDEEIRPVLVTLIKSTRNIVGGMNPEEKEKVLAELGSKLQAIAEKEKSEGLNNEIKRLLEQLGAYNKPYKELKDLYLEQRHSGDDPALFRSLLLKNHRDKLLDLWNLMMDHYEHATDEVKGWFEREFALLR
jgi:hypothetical protein